MDEAKALFNKLASFKSVQDTTKTAEQLLLDYCRQILGAVERFKVDYKEKHDRRDATFHADDKRNLAKAVSGFANSGGGILIWGIEDETLTAKPITGIEQFTATLMQLSSQTTDPVVRGIDSEWLPSDAMLGSGYALLYVPESLLPPHRVILKDGEVKNHYFVRSGSAFVVAPHTQLEDMFGRRPKPQLSLNTRIDVQVHGTAPNLSYTFNVILGIQNEGRGPARAPFLAVEIQPPYHISTNGLDGNGHPGLNRLTTTASSREHRYGASGDVVIHSSITHWVTLVSIGPTPDSELRDMPELIIDYQIAAEGAQIMAARKTIRSINFWNATHQYFSS